MEVRKAVRARIMPTVGKTLSGTDSALARAFEHFATPVAVADADGWLHAANAAFRDLVGLPQEVILTSSLKQLLRPEGEEATGWLWTEPADTPARPVRFECRLAMESGRQTWVSVDARPFHTQGDESAPTVVVTLSEITERKRAEQALAELTAQLLRSQDEERHRIANELHGVTAQDLSALIMDLTRLERLMGKGDPALRMILVECQSLALNVLNEVRTLSYALHPPLLDELGLLAGFQCYVEGFSARSGIAVRFDAPVRMERLPRDVEATLFHVLRECLTNIYRHSGSKSARIALKKTRRHVTLQVSDRGHGMERKRAESQPGGDDPATRGVGIMGMRQWLQQLGGNLEIRSNRRGTTVIAAVPYREKGEQPW